MNEQILTAIQEFESSSIACLAMDSATDDNRHNDMPIEHVISLEYLTYFIVLHCVLAAFCQLLLNEYCIVLYL